MSKVLTVKNLNFKRDNKEILKNLNFDLDENESLAIIGPNGAGKTTLLYCLCGLLENEGDIFIFQTKFNKNSASFLRQKIAFVFQNPDDQLFMPTVFEDISFGLDRQGLSKSEIKNRVSFALDLVNRNDLKNRYSHNLSYGEKKLVCLATAIAKQTKLIMLDEPTSELDPQSRKEFISLIKKADSSKLIVCHDLNLVLETCSKTALLNNGKILAYGNTYNILSNKILMENNRLEVPSLLNKYSYIN